jgi:hypothetical protein
MTGREVAGYAPSGSLLRKLYPAEFMLHSFLSEAYWAYVKARKELWVETNRDGYALVAESKTAKRDIKYIYKTCQDLKVNYYRNKLRDTVLVMGNALMDNKKNKFGGIVELKPLLMEKITERYDRNFDYLLGWDYTTGNKKIFIPYDQVDHLATYNSRSMILGAPACNSVIVDMEAALQAAIYNNNIMRKGGLLSIIVRMKDPQNSSIINDKVSLNLADEFSRWMEKRFGGIRGSGGMAFIPSVDGIDVLNKVSEMDAAWVNLDDRTARKTSLCLGVPPERIGILNGSQYKNVTNVTDNLALSFDNNNYYVQDIVDDYLTRVIIQEGMGIDGVRIQGSGEFSAISKIGAEVGLLIAQMGVDVMTVNQFRVEILHIDPLEGPAGDKFLGEFLRKEKDLASPGLTKAIGQAKHFLPEYQEYKSSKIKYKAKELAFMI